jgi:hypothetical protein
MSEPTPSLKQRAVLEWLLAYPGVEICYSPGWRVWWSAEWVSEAFRQQMIGVMAVLGSDVRGEFRPRVAPIPGPTPHITRPTVEALRRHGWIQPTKLDRGGSIYCQISRAGILAIRPSTAAPKETTQ